MWRSPSQSNNANFQRKSNILGHTSMVEKLPTLAWVMPVYGEIHRLVYESHMCAMGALAKEGLVVTPKFICVTNKMGLATASNMITDQILELKPDYVFWTEMDMILPSYTVTRLLKHIQQYDLKVLSGVYFLRGSGEPCLYRQCISNKEHKYAHTRMATFPKNSIFPVGVPGVGCVMFKREVFEGLKKPIWDDQEGECGQDMYFYTNLREKGIQVYADSSVICDQIDTDEPKMWGLSDYNKWLIAQEKQGGAYGFLHCADEHCIKLEKQIS